MVHKNPLDSNISTKTGRTEKKICFVSEIMRYAAKSFLEMKSNIPHQKIRLTYKFKNNKHLNKCFILLKLNFL